MKIKNLDDRHPDFISVLPNGILINPMGLMSYYDTEALKELRKYVNKSLNFARKNNIEALNSELHRQAMEDSCSRVSTKKKKDIDYNVFVYVMKDYHTGLYKIGRSKNVYAREHTLLGICPKIKTEFFFTSTYNYEKSLHEKFSGKRGRGEWFSLNDEDISWIKNNHDIQIPNWL